MNEPSLEKISDYETLGSEKRKVVFAVILSGLIMGVIYLITSNIYDGPLDTIKVEESIKSIPLR